MELNTKLPNHSQTVLKMANNMIGSMACGPYKGKIIYENEEQNNEVGFGLKIRYAKRRSFLINFRNNFNWILFCTRTCIAKLI